MRQTLCLVVFILLVIPGHASALTVVDEGVAQVDTALDCGAHRGRVVVRTGVHYQISELAERRNGISIAFADDTASALECCWVQFVWMEAIVTFQAPNGQVQNRVQLTAETSGGPVELTTDPNKPKWHVDSAASGSPCYEVEGVSVKDRNGTRTFDQPDDAATELGPQVVARVPAGSVVRVEDVKHFEAYLVCNRRVCFVVRWEQRHTWTPGQGGGPPVYTASGEAAGGISPEQRAALTGEHPNQTVLPP